MDVKRCGMGAAAFLALSFYAAPAMAQACVGVPLSVGQTSLAVSADFPDGGNIFGVRAANRFSSPLAVGASVGAAVPDVGDTRLTIGVDGAFVLPVAALEDAGFGVCGVAGVNFGLDDEPRIISVPVGAAVGGSFEVSDGIAVNPYAVPQLQWTRFSFDGNSTSDTSFGLEAGANLLVSNLFFGVRFNRIFEDNADSLFGVQAGIVF